MLTTPQPDDYNTAAHARERIIGIVTNAGFSFREVEDFDISEIEVRSQVRSDKDVAPQDRVRAMCEWMKRGEPIPPGVITKDGVIIDANSRITSAKRIGRTKLPMLILDCNYDDRAIELLVLGIELNHGQSQEIDKKAKREHTRTLLREGYTVARITEILELDSSTVTSIKQEFLAAEKLQKLKIGKNGNPKALRALGRAADLHDKPFADLAKLVLDAALNAREINDLAKRLREQESDEAMHEVLTAERMKLAGVIHEVKTRGAPKSRPSRALKRVLGGINKYANTETAALLEMQADAAVEYVADVSTAISVLNRILEGQQQLAA